jgi:hypothetical protein
LLVSYAIQYTSSSPGPRYHLREKLCNAMETTINPIDSFATFVTDLFDALGETCSTFSTLESQLVIEKPDADLNQRQWYYQSW